MSLREKSNGLLETHVTWEDIEKSLQLKYGDHIQFGPRRKAVEIGAGKGFLSKICVVEPDWPEDVTLLPSRLAVKISSELPILDLCDSPESEHQLRRVHNCELSVYEILEKYAPKNLVTPKCLRPIACYHAIGLKMTEEEKQNVNQNIYTDTIAPFFNNETVVSFCQSLRSMLGSNNDQLCDELDKIAPLLCSLDSFKKMDSEAESLGMRPLLCHGDLWSTNMLWTKHNGEVELKAIIDSQTTYMGSVGVDLSRCVCSCLSGEDRRKSWKSITEQYYAILLDETDGVVPFTFEQLVESVEFALPFSAFCVVTSFPTSFPDTKITSESMSKAVALIEDMITNFKERKVDN